MTCQQQLPASGNQRGQALVLFAFLLFVIILFLGLAIDLGFGYVTKAHLSKAADAAAMAGIRNLSLGQEAARQLALNTFRANYPDGRLNASAPNVQIQFGTDAANNTTLAVHASTRIHTFFLRLLPSFQTLPVSANAEAMRAKLVMSLVLDRSGSMTENGGSTALPPAVNNFVSLFDDTHDRLSMNSFASHGRTDVPMRTQFKTPIQNALASMRFSGWTASEQGLQRGLEQIQSVSIQPGENVIRVIVFFTDGLANTFLYNFNCGPRNLSRNRTLLDPQTGLTSAAGCTIPPLIDSIVPGRRVSTSDPCALQAEAELRAEHVAGLARNEGVIVFAIGLGDPNGPKECGIPPLNVPFLHRIANSPQSSRFDPNRPVGEAVFAPSSDSLNSLFQQIASRILVRLSR